MVDVLHRQIQFVLVVLGLPAVCGAAIGEHAQQRDLVFLEERQHAVVEQISGHECVLGLMGRARTRRWISVKSFVHATSPRAAMSA